MKAVFTARSDWLGKTITRIDKGPYNHCGVYEPGHDSRGGFIIEANPFEGVRRIPLGPVLSEVQGFAIVELKDLPETELALTWLKQQVGKKYDWRGLAGIAFGADWTSESKWICSALTMMTFIQAGATLDGGGPPGFRYAVGVREAFELLVQMGGVVTQVPRQQTSPELRGPHS